MKNKALFLDRDGTLNRDFGYVYRIEDCELLPGCKEALKMAKDLGYLLVMITNQSGIGRGYYTREDCIAFNQELERKLELSMNAVYICPHTEQDNCLCRKPEIAHVLDAQKKLGICLEQSYFIGDKVSDILCGSNAGTRTVYVGNDKKNSETDAEYNYPNILDFVHHVLCQK